MKASRIITDPGILREKPCIRGTRISVEFILELFASGGTIDSILSDYKHLTREDVEAAIQFAAEYLRHDGLLELEILR